MYKVNDVNIYYDNTSTVLRRVSSGAWWGGPRCEQVAAAG